MWIMNWKQILPAFVFLPVAFASAQHPASTARDQFFRKQAQMRQRAIQFNDLAAHLNSIADAQRLVDMATAEFSEEIPPGWVTPSLRDRIARAEFDSATDPRALIPDKRVAAAWDDYLEKIGAPQKSFVSAAEIHAVRDELFGDTQFTWQHYPTLLYAPNVYATGADKKLADGCRALETARVLWDLESSPESLTAARGRIKLGIAFSDLVKNATKPSVVGPHGSKPPPSGSVKGFAVVQMELMVNPVEEAERKYIQDHGLIAMNAAVWQLLDDLFPK